MPEPYILVVDDDPMILQLVTTQLEGAGFKVTTARDAWQEVVQAKGLPIGLVISDIMMSQEGTGVDAYNRIRSMPELSPKLPMIFMTGISLAKAKKLLPDDPYIRIISKPINFEELQKLIRELIGVDRPLES